MTWLVNWILGLVCGEPSVRDDTKFYGSVPCCIRTLGHRGKHRSETGYRWFQ